ncbi:MULTISPECIES: S8 family serine peptidase [Nocardiopsidaceae]|uniref:S8 family serine peptidase n=2 Tax=Nocardiopsidaceae TaxID=83676 RepID=A0ABY6YKW5_9ACTN|nr:S8 family serine peptidase [Streptomonospora nanhaiensis]MEE2042666.1 S8 family serine peptidase [Nocardiopsis tropica]WAE72656.1 S8 family serine peptidase [Streptomonospora nanhaiensis]
MVPHRSRLAALAGLTLVAGLAASTPANADEVSELAPLHPAPSSENGELTHQANGLWFIELESPPTTEGTSPATVDGEHEDFRAEAEEHGLEYTERHSFSELWNGLSVRMDDTQVGTAREIPGVSAIHPVLTYRIPETGENVPDLDTALPMTGSDIAQNELGLTGEGLRVAIMDTGVDYTHPDLGGGGFPNDRVVVGHDFVGDDFNAGDPASVPVPDDDPQDCNGHGTHVAGIVGAEGGVTGVAPAVEFGAYKVFGCTGSTTSDIMIAAMEQALADDMDVLNMSIGSSHSWPQYPTAVASDNLVDEGMVVVASIGNEGATGLYSAGAPGLGEDVIGVASFDNTHIQAASVTANPSGEALAYMEMGAAEPPPASGDTDELVHVGRGCTALGDEVADLEGRTALMVRGECTFAEKYDAALDAGATGVVMYNNVPGMFAGGGIVDRGAFSIGVSDEAGAHLLELLEGDEPVTLTWTGEDITIPNPTGGLISSFSSFGLAADLSLKPDIGAPGGLINSTYPMDQGGYATISGTSMSSPHVAGGVALLLQARPDLDSHEVRTVLQNSADPKAWWGNPGLGHPDNVHRQGAGMLDVPGSVLATTTVTPGKLSLGATGEAVTETVTITNDGDGEATYELSHEAALGTHGDTFAPGYNDGSAEVAFDSDSVTVPAGGSAEVRVTVTPPAQDFEQMIYGGYVTVSETGGETYRVPYAAYNGDYQEIEAMTPISDGSGVVADLPWLTRITECEAFSGLDCASDSGGTFENQPDGASYTMEWVDGLPDVPYVIAHFDHHVTRLDMVVIDERTGRPVHPDRNVGVSVDYVHRSATRTSFFSYPWDGTVVDRHGRITDVRDGSYRLEARALKALGDPDNPDHWETWTSPVITIDRG